jgi:hypothetical protein
VLKANMHELEMIFNDVERRNENKNLDEKMGK